MPKPFRKLTLAEFADLLARFRFARKINAVHMHHTWKPRRRDYDGLATIEGIWRFHTVNNGWSDIAQHVTIAPDGSIWTGRGWNEPPASAAGHNGNRAAGPFMFEMIGDFDTGRDPFQSPQRDAVLEVIARVQRHFRLPVESLRFHNQMSPKSCPGSALRYGEVLEAVRGVRERLEREASRGAVSDSPFPAEARTYREKTDAIAELFASREARTDDPPDAEHPAEDQPEAETRAARYEDGDSTDRDGDSTERQWSRLPNRTRPDERDAPAGSEPGDWSRIAPFATGKKQQAQPPFGGSAGAGVAWDGGVAGDSGGGGGGDWNVIAGAPGKASKFDKVGKTDKADKLGDFGDFGESDKKVPYTPAAASTGNGAERPGRRRALCVGIDTYPTAPLQGCVADARTWAGELKDLGFEVSLMLNEQASRGRLLAALDELVKSSAAGDIIVFQYAGHGTTVRDVSGDEVVGNNREDEALCPHDFDEGALLIDDDVAEVFAGLPDGVNLTCFFDCCHSGSISRFAVGVSEENEARARGARPRFVPASPALQQAHAEFRRRQGKRGLSGGSRGPDSMKQVVFAACLDSEVAWESNGQGDFTRVAAPLLRAAQGLTNEDFSRAVVGKFGASPRQHPELDCAPRSKSLGFLRSLARGAADERPAATLTTNGSPAWGLGTGGAAVVDLPSVREALRTLARFVEGRV
ncbi:MAG: caspase family protein [Pyrinomonadaceae bacterium]